MSILIFKKQSIKAVFVLLLGIFSGCKLGGQTTSTEFNLLVGTYTKPGKSEGIYVYHFNSKTGEISYRSKVTGIENPSYLTISKDHKYVYSVNEVGGGEGSASSFSFDSSTGKLNLLNKASSGGNGPCYIAVDNSNTFAFVGNYSGGNISAIPIKTDGSFDSSIQSIRHEVEIKQNQKKGKSHVHAAVLSPDNQYVFVPDLGADKVYVYTVNTSSSNPLTPATPAFIEVKKGSGPRHFTFHPNGKLAYVIQELTGDVTAFEYGNGQLKKIQEVSLLDVNQDENGADAADIHISPDGKFLYGSLRGEINELVCYAINEEGKLNYVNRYATLGKGPRNFAIDPTGQFLLVGNGGSDEIIIFKRNQKTGELSSTGEKISVGAPVCLKFVAIE